MIIYVLAFLSSVFIVANVLLIFCLFQTHNTEYMEMRDDERVWNKSSPKYINECRCDVCVVFFVGSLQTITILFEPMW